MKNNELIITISNTEFKATLDDNETVNDFCKLLPLSITMNDLNNNEKYLYLKKNIKASPKQMKRINAGDIMLFGNNCLVIFYESFNTVYSYTKIGSIVDINSFREIVGKKDIKVKLEIK